jgi:subtilisin family serine protease
MTSDLSRLPIAPPERPVQFDRSQGLGKDINVDALIRVVEARNLFTVDGAGLTVAVLDTGLRATHVDFAGRVSAQQNFTEDNGGKRDDAADGNGHGTNVGGIIVANGIHVGIAPGAGIIPLKVLDNEGGGGFDVVAEALSWVLENHERFGVSVVSMSLGAESNPSDDAALQDDAIRPLLQQLRARNIPVVIAAGNSYFKFKEEGMGYPAIFREAISVGAVYDVRGPGVTYGDGSSASSTAPDQITPFSQRLSEGPSRPTRTTIFSPGAPVVSAGIANDRGESIQQGTSQATPVVAGVLLLLQQFHQRSTGKLPPVDLLVDCLRLSGVVLTDGDGGLDNVPHSNKSFPRVDALGALGAMSRALTHQLLATGTPLRSG